MLNKNTNYGTVNKSAIFDWLVFSISITLGFIFPSLSSFASSPVFSDWLLTGLLLYIAGAWLKHLPVHYRLTVGKEKPRDVPYIIFLLIGHWMIMLAAIIFSESAIRQIAHLQPLTGEETNTGYIEVIAIVGGIFITWIVYSPARKYKTTFDEKYLNRRELIADILLVSGVSILSFVFWDKTILSLCGNMPLNKTSDIVSLFFFLSFGYVLFYLPLRYLYLIEDHTNNQTWRRLLLIFMLLLIRALLTALFS